MKQMNRHHYYAVDIPYNLIYKIMKFIRKHNELYAHYNN